MTSSIVHYLAHHEVFEFDWTTPSQSGKAFVRSIVYTAGNTHVALCGPNKNADGSRGFVDRNDTMPLTDLPHSVLLVLESKAHAEIERWRIGLAKINAGILKAMEREGIE
jgi:hypothetical protein